MYDLIGDRVTGDEDGGDTLMPILIKLEMHALPLL
jgi:hypothetical protein